MNMDDAQIRRRIQELLFNTPLFAPKAISFAEGHALFAAPLVVDGWCPHCRKTSTFYRNRGGKSILQIRPLLDGREPLYFDLTCTRDVKHHIMFSFRLGNNQIQKTAQYPPGVYEYKTLPWGSAAFTHMRGAIHKIASCFYFDEPQIIKTGQYLAAAVADRKSTLGPSAALGHMRRAAQSVTSLFSLQEKPVRKKGLSSDPARIADNKHQAGHAAAFAKTKTLWGEWLRTAAPHLKAVRIELLVAFALAGIGIFMVHENAKRQTAFQPQVEETVQRAGPSADDQSNEAETARLGITALEQRFDERFEILRKELETVNHSISHDDTLIAAINTRIDKEEAALNARLDQQKQESDASKLITADKMATTTPKANKPPQDGAKNERLERGEASLNELTDQQEPESNASGPIALDNTAFTTPKASKPPNSSVPHLGIGVAKATGLEKRGGVVIVEVDPGSPAGKAGVRKHDLLLKVDGTAVSRPDQLREALLSLKGSHTIILTLLREGKTQNNKVILR
jgi:hypothetical protein